MSQGDGNTDPFALVGDHAIEIGSVRIKIQLFLRESALTVKPVLGSPSETIPLGNEDGFGPEFVLASSHDMTDEISRVKVEVWVRTLNPVPPFPLNGAGPSGALVPGAGGESAQIPGSQDLGPSGPTSIPGDVNVPSAHVESAPASAVQEEAHNGAVELNEQDIGPAVQSESPRKRSKRVE